MEVFEKYENKKWIHKANLYFIVNGKVYEEILMNVPYPTARKEKKRLLLTPDYKLGKLVVVSARNKDQQAAIDKELNKL
jgi:hypothetical protein